RAAVRGVAAPVRAGQPGRVADEVDQQLARLDVARHLFPVDGDRHLHGQSSEAIRPASSNSSSEGGLPRSRSSARVTWMVVGPTALSATPASAIVPFSTQRAAEAAAIAQSPARRST